MSLFLPERRGLVEFSKVPELTFLVYIRVGESTCAAFVCVFIGQRLELDIFLDCFPSYFLFIFTIIYLME